MSDLKLDRGMAQLMGAHLLAMSKASAVYQAELAKAFLGLEDEEEGETGPAYKMMRDLEKVGFASAMFDQSPEANKRRLRSLNGTNAVLLENWLAFMGQPWSAYWKAMSQRGEDDDS